jgi:hypothetical protein
MKRRLTSTGSSSDDPTLSLASPAVADTLVEPLPRAPEVPAASTRSPAVDALQARVGESLEDVAVEPTHDLQGIELRSLAKFAFAFYGIAFIVVTIGLIVMVALAWVVGAVGRFEQFMRDIGFRDFHLLAPKLIFGLMLVGLAVVVLLTLMTVVAAACYNLVAGSGHAIQVRMSPHHEPASTVAGDDAVVATPRRPFSRRPKPPRAPVAAMVYEGVPRTT